MLLSTNGEQGSELLLRYENIVFKANYELPHEDVVIGDTTNAGDVFTSVVFNLLKFRFQDKRLKVGQIESVMKDVLDKASKITAWYLRNRNDAFTELGEAEIRRIMDEI